MAPAVNTGEYHGGYGDQPCVFHPCNVPAVYAGRRDIKKKTLGVASGDRFQITWWGWFDKQCIFPFHFINH